MTPDTAVFFMRKIKEAFEEAHLNTEAEALQMGIDALKREKAKNDIAVKALDPEWQEEHHRLGFASPIYDLMHMFDDKGEGEQNEQT